MSKAVRAKQKAGFDANTSARLRSSNVRLAIFHAEQGLAILLLSPAKLAPVTVSYNTTDPIATELAGHRVLTSVARHMFDMNIVYVVGAFFLVSAAVHALSATLYRKQYEANLTKGFNIIRWIDYAVSGGLVMLALALAAGVTDAGSLLMIVVLVAAAQLLAMIMERQGETNATTWMTYALSCAAMAVPFIILAGYFLATWLYGSGGTSNLLYGAYASALLLFGFSAACMVAQRRGRGQWQQPVYAERVYMLVSLLLKTVVAWQLFVGVFKP